MENDQTLTALPPGDHTGTDDAEARSQLAHQTASDITTANTGGGSAHRSLTFFQEQPTLRSLGSNTRFLRWVAVIMSILAVISLAVASKVRSDAAEAKRKAAEQVVAAQHDSAARVAEANTKRTEYQAEADRKVAEAQAKAADADARARVAEADAKETTCTARLRIPGSEFGINCK